MKNNQSSTINRQSKKVVFLGSSKYVLPILEVLRSNFSLELVITTDKTKDDPIPLFCNKNKINWLKVTNINDDLINKVKKIGAEFAVLADFGLILPQEFLNIFPKGVLNIHPSLLPKHRGPTPAQTAILNGDKTTGVSLIKLDNLVDHGPIVSQKEELIREDDTAESLYLKLFKTGAGLLEKDAKEYLHNKIKTTPQDDRKATFSEILNRDKGKVKLGNFPKPETLRRMIRAYYPWPGTWGELMIDDKLLRIKFLPENKIQVEGKKPMDYKDFVNGYSQGKEILKKLNLI